MRNVSRTTQTCSTATTTITSTTTSTTTLTHKHTHTTQTQGECVSTCDACSHDFHVHCTTVWMMNQRDEKRTAQCPLCRAEWATLKSSQAQPRDAGEQQADTIMHRAQVAGRARAADATTTADAPVAARTAPAHARREPRCSVAASDRGQGMRC